MKKKTLLVLLTIFGVTAINAALLSSFHSISFVNSLDADSDYTLTLNSSNHLDTDEVSPEGQEYTSSSAGGGWLRPGWGAAFGSGATLYRIHYSRSR